MRILFTSVGRRVELVQSFRDAANKHGMDLQIYGADMSITAPALCFCNRTILVPRITDPEYISVLLTTCKEEKVDLLIPTIDTDLLVLAEHKKDFEAAGTKVLISAPDKIEICRDKRKTYQFFKYAGVEAPKTVDAYEEYCEKYPAFIKPRDGSSSIHTHKVNDAHELEAFSQIVPNYIIQPYIKGTEYTVDAFCDFEGNIISITPRIRLAVRSGEVLKTKIVQDGKIIAGMKKILTHFRPCGPITVQLIREEETDEDFYIEINPRFGGGAPLSMKAGANVAECILCLLSGKSLECASVTAKEGMEYSRFDQSVCVRMDMEAAEIKGVIFDLDDTLYSEKQYIRSGFRKIAEYLGALDAEVKLWEYFCQKNPAVDLYLEERGLMEKKEHCLKTYREQMADITLYDGIVDMLSALKAKGIKLGIITDGRVEGQKNKIKALGLEKIIDDIIITDELGGPQFRKPNDISFRIMQKRWNIPFEQLIYVGDNPVKDFIAPCSLGMNSLFFKNEDGLYSNALKSNANQNIVHSIVDMRTFLESKLGC